MIPDAPLSLCRGDLAGGPQADDEDGTPAGHHLLRWLYGLASHGPTASAEELLRQLATVLALAGPGGPEGPSDTRSAEEQRRAQLADLVAALGHVSQLLHTWSEAAHRLGACM